MKNVIFSLLGTNLDYKGKGADRWNRWRPNIAICQQETMIVDRLELIFDNHSQKLADQATQDINAISPETDVVHHRLNFINPWDFEGVFSGLMDFARSYEFNTQDEEYLIHITTGTHVAQICWYLLTEAHYFPAKLLQSSPSKERNDTIGNYQIIDLDLSKYDQIAARFQREHTEGAAFLKSGIHTNNTEFNNMIEQLEKVSLRSSEPILLTGATGAGKSQLAERIFELRKLRSKLKGELVTVNCATLAGENAMSTLFGHKKGSFTGATSDRAGLLKQANNGLLFLDEIGELGLDEQAMLLRAIEKKSFLPFGSDKEIESNFQLIAGTNKNLINASKNGEFREDLLARIDLWSYHLPSLKDRIEDLEPNIEFELEKFSQKSGSLVSFNKNAKSTYLTFSKSPQATWNANFRDLNASITRMATLADGARITEDIVQEEIIRLKHKWQPYKTTTQQGINLLDYVDQNRLAQLDLLDQLQLQSVIKVCQESDSMADAGRKLFNVSRTQKSSTNDSHRIRQLLSKYELNFRDLKQ